MTEKTPVELEVACIDAIRVLAMDAVQKADSGHPGTPMALAPLAYVLWTRHLRYNPGDPHWINRDRFILSCGHASMLLYSVFYLTGYDLTLDDIKNFRQLNSKTPGHPEYGHTPGVETTTGPLGQGFSNAVGMAVAEAHTAKVFNREQKIIDHYTYFIVSDGDMMEGISNEVASFAGHNKLGRLIGFYDDNHITIEGNTDLTFSDNTRLRFEGYGWHVQFVADVKDLQALDDAIEKAKAVTDRPSLVITRTHIGYGSPNKQDTSAAHGSPLGVEEIKLTKENLGIPSQEPFYVEPDALAFWRNAGAAGGNEQGKWNQIYEAWKTANPDLCNEFERRESGHLMDGWEDLIPTFDEKNGNVATRSASGAVINAIAPKVPELIGGSADLASSTDTIVKGAPSFGPDSYEGRNFHFGIREHGMGGIMNGMALYGGIIPYGATFLIFSDYMRPPMRLACMMRRRLVYVFTHDSIGLGEDGPTHQPIEQLSSLRAVPNMTVIRPADANETAEAWRVALTLGTPVCLILTRQKLMFIDRSKYAAASGVARGAYVLADVRGGEPEVVLMASGSEVEIILKAQDTLATKGIRARAVSVPSMELFAQQDQEYRDSVLPPGIKRVSIEASQPMSWYKWIGEGGVAIGLEHFGASAPYKELYKEFHLTPENVVETATKLVGK
ncbi:MAG: transketolase [Gemmatimonadota bacterium]|nr:transketolase [Gemmatimonadota bacterium]